MFTSFLVRSFICVCYIIHFIWTSLVFKLNFYCRCNAHMCLEYWKFLIIQLLFVIREDGKFHSQYFNFNNLQLRINNKRIVTCVYPTKCFLQKFLTLFYENPSHDDNNVQLAKKDKIVYSWDIVCWICFQLCSHSAHLPISPFFIVYAMWDKLNVPQLRQTRVKSQRKKLCNHIVMKWVWMNLIEIRNKLLVCCWNIKSL
jgi:hypothetical protein